MRADALIDEWDINHFDYDKKTKVYQTKQAQDTVDKPLCGITTEYDRG